MKDSVRKLANICMIFSRLINWKEIQVIHEESDIDFTPNFVTELVKFVSEVIGNY
jgi:hypothetical protein